MPACPNCHAPVEPSASLCEACGEVLDRDDSAPFEPPDTLLGTTIAGNFKIEGLLGEGAMGRVYRARQLSLEKPVAVKVLHKHLTNDPRIAKRFHREARAASRLSHANSIQVIDFGTADDGTLYIAMELLEGVTLQAVINEEFPFSPARIDAIMQQVLAVLDEAHHAGIVHRDLKPDNVVVIAGRGGREEKLKVCDFGIAKILETDTGSAITISGYVCGTPEYMPPEQARGEEMGPGADIYSAGVMLYQLLVGKVPFKADTALGIITKHLTEPPIAPHLRAPELGIPPAMERVALRAMQKDPKQRFTSAAEMAAALSTAVRGLGEAASERLGDGTHQKNAVETQNATTLEALSARPPPKRGRSIGLFVAMLCALLILGLFLRSRSERAPSDDVAGVTPRAASPPNRVAAEEVVAPRSAATPNAAPIPPSPAVVEGTPTATEPARPPPTKQRPASGDHPTAPTSVEIDTPPPSGQDADRSPGEIAYDQGRERFLANDVRGAITRFEEAARAMPSDARVQKQLGRAYMRAGDVDRGAAAYRRYLELAPDAPDRTIVQRILERGGE